MIQSSGLKELPQSEVVFTSRCQPEGNDENGHNVPPNFSDTSLKQSDRTIADIDNHQPSEKIYIQKFREVSAESEHSPQDTQKNTLQQSKNTIQQLNTEGAQVSCSPIPKYSQEEEYDQSQCLQNIYPQSCHTQTAADTLEVAAAAEIAVAVAAEQHSEKDQIRIKDVVKSNKSSNQINISEGSSNISSSAAVSLLPSALASVFSPAPQANNAKPNTALQTEPQTSATQKETIKKHKLTPLQVSENKINNSQLVTKLEEGFVGTNDKLTMQDYKLKVVDSKTKSQATDPKLLNAKKFFMHNKLHELIQKLHQTHCSKQDNDSEQRESTFHKKISTKYSSSSRSRSRSDSRHRQKNGNTNYKGHTMLLDNHTNRNSEQTRNRGVKVSPKISSSASSSRCRQHRPSTSIATTKPETEKGHNKTESRRTHKEFYSDERRTGSDRMRVREGNSPKNSPRHKHSSSSTRHTRRHTSRSPRRLSSNDRHKLRVQAEPKSPQSKKNIYRERSLSRETADRKADSRYLQSPARELERRQHSPSSSPVVHKKRGTSSPLSQTQSQNCDRTARDFQEQPIVCLSAAANTPISIINSNIPTVFASTNAQPFNPSMLAPGNYLFYTHVPQACQANGDQIDSSQYQNILQQIIIKCSQDGNQYQMIQPTQILQSFQPLQNVLPLQQESKAATQQSQSQIEFSSAKAPTTTATATATAATCTPSQTEPVPVLAPAPSLQAPVQAPTPAPSTLDDNLIRKNKKLLNMLLKGQIKADQISKVQLTNK